MICPKLRSQLADQPHRLSLLLVAVTTRGRLPRPSLCRHDPILVSKVRSLQLSQGDSLLKNLTPAAASRLLEAFGVGLDVAAQIVITAGDNTERVRNEAAFAKICGVCPIPAGSGKTNGRHRLNRGGNRQANAALYRTVIVGMRWHEPTIAYVARRTGEGLSKKDIIRCLKRYLARELYQLLPATSSSHHTRTEGLRSAT
jgi:transposase